MPETSQPVACFCKARQRVVRHAFNSHTCQGPSCSCRGDFFGFRGFGDACPSVFLLDV